MFYPNNTVENLIFRQRFPSLVPLLQWTLPGLLLLQRLLYLLHPLHRERLPALLLQLLEMMLFRLLLILMLQLLLRRSLPGLLLLLSTLKDRLGDQRRGSEWEPINILLQRENSIYVPNSQPRIPTRVCQGRVVTTDLPTLGTNPKQSQSKSKTQGAKDLVAL
jgi:hypothetical protein